MRRRHAPRGSSRRANSPDGGRRPRFLFVSRQAPWPARSGAALRRRTAIEALSRHGSVDLLLLEEHDEDPDAGIDALVEDVTKVEWPGRRLGARAVVRWAVRRQPPSELVGFDFRELRGRVRSRVDGRYDLVWLCRAETWVALGDLAIPRAVVDLDDLEFIKYRLKARETKGRSLATRARALRYRLLASDWARLQRRTARETDAVIVCSSADAVELRAPNAVVIPNTYPRPAEPAGAHWQPDDSPVLLLIGLMTYGPNADGATWLAEDVLPRVLESTPHTRLRIVGRTGGRVDRLAGPNVEVVGEVESIEAELARAAAVVVPIQYGAGTRIKILEAFAHRIPVVSTTVGCHGLAVEDNRHLLVRDTAAGFARACVELLTDRARASSLTASAAQLYDESYTEAAAQEAIDSLLQRLGLAEAALSSGAEDALSDGSNGSPPTEGGAL